MKGQTIRQLINDDNAYYSSYIVKKGICIILSLSLTSFLNTAVGFIDLGEFRFVGCETGWLEFNGHCYIEGQSLATWNDAHVK